VEAAKPHLAFEGGKRHEGTGDGRNQYGYRGVLDEGNQCGFRQE
jgi:hypothetical protein